MIVHDRTQKRLNRIRNQIKSHHGIPRLTVFRTNQHIWVQIIDDRHGRTLAATSSKTMTIKKGTKTEVANLVGQEIAKIALKNKISQVRFDRGAYKYHGRVKALADAARQGGLKF